MIFAQRGLVPSPACRRSRGGSALRDVVLVARVCWASALSRLPRCSLAPIGLGGR